jgi:hypothetical protein
VKEAENKKDTGLLINLSIFNNYKSVMFLVQALGELGSFICGKLCSLYVLCLNVCMTKSAGIWGLSHQIILSENANTLQDNKVLRKTSTAFSKKSRITTIIIV